MKNNLLANGLMVLIGVLLLFSAVQMLGWGSAIKPLEAEPFDKSQLPNLDNMEVTDSNASEQKDYSEIVQAPLFNSDREPFIPEEEVDDPTDGGDDPPASPLDIQVTSIIMTPEDSYVMIHDKVINKRLTLKQGMPLEGEQGAWFVEEIQSRLVKFAAEGQETVELELEVFKGALQAGNKRKAARAANNRKNKKNANSSTARQAKKDSAAEIRKKIAERRAQMRADAANRKN
ncbi:MAG: hypothetical protein L3J52_02785 [Proteobacteria bacterium]|nr:hypothetical protein [Pseudomonadota bacterium]